MRGAAPSAVRFHLGAFAVLALLCAGLYAHALDGDFLLDDVDNILRNPYDRWTELDLETVRGAIVGPAVKRPVAHVTFGLNHYFGGYDPRGYRFVNVLVHLVNALLVYGLALMLLRRLPGLREQAAPSPDEATVRWMALFAALVFAAHPLQIQSVTYVVQRMNSLACTFYLGAILLYLHGRASHSAARRRFSLAAAIASGLLALGSKEVAVTLPVAIGLIDWYFFQDLDRGWMRRRWPLVAGMAFGALALAVYFAGSSGYEGRDFDAGERLLTQLRVTVFYLSLVALPAPSRLNLLHEIEPSRSPIDPVSTLLAGLLLLGLAVLAVRAARRHRVLSFAIVWFLLQLALEGSTVPLRMIFEHRTYLPLVGPALLASYALFTALRGRPRVAIAVASGVVVLLSGATWLRNATWSDARSLWLDVAAKSPGDSLARMQLASVQARDGRLPEALSTLEQAIRLDPRSPRPHNLRGAVLLAQGRREEALAAHLEARRLDARDHVARAHAAAVLVDLGRLEEAAQLYEEALGLMPEEAYALALGRVREREGHVEEALTLYRRAVAMNPRQREARLAAAILLARSGRGEEAVAAFRGALENAPDPDAELHMHLGTALWLTGKRREALAELDTAVTLAPDWPVATAVLTWMLATGPDAELRDPERAIALAGGALARSAGPEPALGDALAAAYASAGRFAEAVATADRAAREARAAGDDGLAAGIEARGKLYRSGAVPAPPL